MFRSPQFFIIKNALEKRINKKMQQIQTLAQVKNQKAVAAS